MPRGNAIAGFQPRLRPLVPAPFAAAATPRDGASAEVHPNLFGMAQSMERLRSEPRFHAENDDHRQHPAIYIRGVGERNF
jgi:hypothetical protein